MIENKVVIRYIDGRTKRGTTNNFVPDRETFHLLPEGAPPESIPLMIHVSDLKAVFFVREFDSRLADHSNQNHDAGQKIIGRDVKVVFIDGEVLRGTTNSYNTNRQGFFMNPADSTSNNERCFVVRKATKIITVT